MSRTQRSEGEEMETVSAVPPGKTEKAPIEFKSIALKGLFIISLFYTLYFARDLIIPLVLALLLNFLLRPVVRALARLKIPLFLGAALVVLILIGGIGYGVMKISRPAVEWIDKLPGSLRQVEVKVSFLRKPAERINRAAEEVKRMTRLGGEGRPEVEVKTPGITATVLTGTQEILIKSSMMFILLYFLLASGDLFLRKSLKLFPVLSKQKQIVRISREVQHHISRYLYTVTVINALLGLSVGIGMYLIGMPNAALWGVMAGCLIFIPYVGSLAGITIVTIVAFLTFDSIGRILLVPAIYIALETIQGQLITPMVLGFRFALNPVVIFLWLIFWGWMWGIVGAVLAFPMLTVFKILCDHIKSLRPISEFLDR